MFTEKQMERILGEDLDIFLNKSSEGDGEINGNAFGNEVFSNLGNADDDVPNSDVTDADALSQKLAGGHPFSTRKRRVYESNFDDERSNMFGRNEKQQISTFNGKMAKNLSKELNGEKSAPRQNTLEVRASRLKQQKKSDPVTYAKNGGKQMEKALKSATNKMKAKHGVAQEIKDNSMQQMPNANKGTGKGHHSEQENVYYY